MCIRINQIEYVRFRFNSLQIRPILEILNYIIYLTTRRWFRDKQVLDYKTT